MTIGTLARRAGTSPRALRHYEALGLLKPVRNRPSGYRAYTAEDLIRVQEIRSLLGLGLSLRQVTQVLTGAPVCPRRLLEVQLARVDREAERLSRLRDRLLQLHRTLEREGRATHAELLLSIEALHALESPDLDPVLLELGPDLLPLCDPGQADPPLLAGLTRTRACLKEQGTFLPGVRLKDSEQLAPTAYRLTFLRTLSEQGQVDRTRLLAAGDPERLPGPAEPQPLPGIGPAAWIPPGSASARKARVARFWSRPK